jgi:putative transposon-encoded protein
MVTSTVTLSTVTIMVINTINDDDYFPSCTIECTWYTSSISFYCLDLFGLETNIYYVHPYLGHMVRRMKAVFTQIESIVTPSGNSGHVVVPKAWIGKEAIVTLKESKAKGKK